MRSYGPTIAAYFAVAIVAYIIIIAFEFPSLSSHAVTVVEHAAPRTPCEISSMAGFAAATKAAEIIADCVPFERFAGQFQKMLEGLKGSQALKGSEATGVCPCCGFIGKLKPNKDRFVCPFMSQASVLQYCVT